MTVDTNGVAYRQGDVINHRDYPKQKYEVRAVSREDGTVIMRALAPLELGVAARDEPLLRPHKWVING